eukprot:1184360-Prorocentrum_minimum.AAC.3
MRARPTTALIIAHQVPDLEKCDHVVVMSEGRAVQQGTPTELAECAEGVYASLLRAHQGQKSPATSDPSPLT